MIGILFFSFEIWIIFEDNLLIGFMFKMFVLVKEKLFCCGFFMLSIWIWGLLIIFLGMLNEVFMIFCWLSLGVIEFRLLDGVSCWFCVLYKEVLIWYIFCVIFFMGLGLKLVCFIFGCVFLCFYFWFVGILLMILYGLVFILLFFILYFIFDGFLLFCILLFWYNVLDDCNFWIFFIFVGFGIYLMVWWKYFVGDGGMLIILYWMFFVLGIWVWIWFCLLKNFEGFFSWLLNVWFCWCIGFDDCWLFCMELFWFIGFEWVFCWLFNWEWFCCVFWLKCWLFWWFGIIGGFWWFMVLGGFFCWLVFVFFLCVVLGRLVLFRLESDFFREWLIGLCWFLWCCWFWWLVWGSCCWFIVVICLLWCIFDSVCWLFNFVFLLGFLCFLCCCCCLWKFWIWFGCEFFFLRVFIIFLVCILFDKWLWFLVFVLFFVIYCEEFCVWVILLCLNFWFIFFCFCKIWLLWGICDEIGCWLNLSLFVNCLLFNYLLWLLLDLVFWKLERDFIFNFIFLFWKFIILFRGLFWGMWVFIFCICVWIFWWWELLIMCWIGFGIIGFVFMERDFCWFLLIMMFVIFLVFDIICVDEGILVGLIVGDCFGFCGVFMLDNDVFNVLCCCCFWLWF